MSNHKENLNKNIKKVIILKIKIMNLKVLTVKTKESENNNMMMKNSKEEDYQDRKINKINKAKVMIKKMRNRPIWVNRKETQSICNHKINQEQNKIK